MDKNARASSAAADVDVAEGGGESDDVDELEAAVVENLAGVISHEVDIVTSGGAAAAAAEDGASAAASVRRGVRGRHRGWSAIDDARYEKLLPVLRDGDRLDPRDPDYKALHRLSTCGRLRAERRFDAALGEELWRVVDSESGRIVPRLSDVPLVLAFFYEANGRPGARTLMGLCNRSYCGVGKQHADEFVTRKDVATRRHALHFRQTRPHRLEAAKPMQHVQIDVVDMPEVGYGAKSYGHLLVVQCMFSRFVFARALPFRERSLLTRHLMDVFGTFGPPEAFQTLSGNACIDASMPDIAHMFNVEIQCYGRNGLSSATTQDQFGLRRQLVERSELSFGDHLHWVEVLPLALMERNMQPHAAFAMKLTPFEVMFGRQPWFGDPQPPWIEEDGRDVQHADLHQRTQLINSAGDESPVEMFEMDGELEEESDAMPSVGLKRLLDDDADDGLRGSLDVEQLDDDADAPPPPTLESFAGCPQEHVAEVPSVDAADALLADDDGLGWREAKARTLGVAHASHTRRQAGARRAVTALRSAALGRRRRLDQNVRFLPGDDVYVRNRYGDRGLKRYTRAMVIDVAPHEKTPYLVRFSDMVLRDGSLREEWVATGDVTAATKELERLRASQSAKPAQLCQCADADCRRVRSGTCEFALHRVCCAAAGNECRTHDKRAFPPQTQRRRLQQARAAVRRSARLPRPPAAAAAEPLDAAVVRSVADVVDSLSAAARAADV